MAAWFLSVSQLPAFLILFPLTIVCLIALMLVLKPGTDLKVKAFGIKIQMRREGLQHQRARAGRKAGVG